RPQALDAADEDSERGRVDERRAAEVDDDVLAALSDHLEQLLLELGRRVEVDLAGERDDICVAAELLGLDVEVHADPPKSSPAVCQADRGSVYPRSGSRNLLPATGGLRLAGARLHGCARGPRELLDRLLVLCLQRTVRIDPEIAAERIERDL